MSLVCDHSSGGAIIGGTLRQKGFNGCVRYACEDRGDVNITPAEVHDLKINGVAIGIVLEHEADWLLHPNVIRRTRACVDITRACGLPDGPVYGAADWDCTLGGPTRPGSPGYQNMRAIAHSMEMMGSVLGRENVGFYGSKFAIDDLVLMCPWIKWYWQTEAWSMRQQSRHACLFQRAQQMTVAGVQVDIDDPWHSAWGQRSATPPHPPHPKGKGHLNFSGSYFGNENGGEWSAHGTHSDDAVFGPAELPDKWARAEYSICVQGPHRGQHRIKPLDWGK